MRKPNCNCKVCNKEIYRRLHELKSNVYCSKECFRQDRGVLGQTECETCKCTFKKSKRKSRFCSKSCANSNRRGISYSKESWGNKSQTRLALLRNTFNLSTCMVEGCSYNRCFDIHRIVEGKDGGQYEIGNMFAICPNHHAEIHRDIVSVEKLNDYTLRVVDRKLL